ncbi:YigZ family protein [Anaerobium acetethylicum]|uniref:Uncharacterized protein, YigZ family n=1 Tax=Anaerobium acetethylicum TaxID=1619234 RepID=A0A1D3TXT3_9FIRM|nr:YigZ family protein [Anaerobium acetethylicum]SCP99182.1 uncharacterized protein, YigZ family [Anaerobium acetethylicum]
MGLETYKAVHQGGEGEIIEKKSRFIATVVPVETEEEAVAFIDAMKKKYWNAAHNCSAFVIGKRQELQRCSDDGEPSGTAGRPMLDVLLGEGICNVVVVVTRYFGGTLLGTGGLVRAYQSAVKAGLEQSVIIEKKPGIKLGIRTDYNGLGKVQHILGERRIPITGSEYSDVVKLEAMVPADEKEKLKEDLTEATMGRAGLTEGDQVFFALVDGEVLVFDEQ